MTVVHTYFYIVKDITYLGFAQSGSGKVVEMRYEAFIAG